MKAAQLILICPYCASSKPTNEPDKGFVKVLYYTKTTRADVAREVCGMRNRCPEFNSARAILITCRFGNVWMLLMVQELQSFQPKVEHRVNRADGADPLLPFPALRPHTFGGREGTGGVSARCTTLDWTILLQTLVGSSVYLLTELLTAKKENVWMPQEM